jgi:site-specific DNA-methyltransferase (adenine-specific)
MCSGSVQKAGKGSRLDGKPLPSNQNHHPTVKPLKLMSYLIKMVTPPGGVVLDPFAGSGSTGVAAVTDGFKFLGIEKDPTYLKIAKKRIFHAFPKFRKQLHLGEKVK